MNIHEYQAKELLARFDLPILKGKVYFNKIKNNEEISKFIQGPPWVVKAQIHAGGRGAGKFKTDFNLKGGVQIIKDGKKLIDTANSMLGNILITKQTGQEGKKVNRVFIEEGCTIKREFYLILPESNLLRLPSFQGLIFSILLLLISYRTLVLLISENFLYFLC